MHITKIIILTILIAAGNIVCRIGLSHDEIRTTKSDSGYHHFERGIDNVGIIVENVVPASIGSVSSHRHQTNNGRIHTDVHKTIERYYGNIRSKVFRCCLTTASRPHTLYFIFALHRMRN